MYVCMFVTHPSEVEQPRASRKQNSGGKGVGACRRPGATSGKRRARRRPGATSGKGKVSGEREKGSRLAPGVHASTIGGKERNWARASPSPGRASAGTASAITVRGVPLGAVLGAPPAYKCKPFPNTAPSERRTAGVRASGSQASEGASAPGLRLPPCRQSVAGPRPHSPHCLERLRRRPRPQEDGRDRRG